MGKLRKIVQDLTFGNRSADAADVPKRGPGLFWFVLRNHYLALIGLNLLFLALCLPIVTIPAAYSGLVAVTASWARRVPDTEVFPVFFREFRSNFFGKLGVWLITTIAPFSIAGYVYLLSQNAVAFLASLVLTAMLAFLVQSYFFSQLAVLSVPVGTALKNAFLLLGVEWKATLHILLTGGVILLLFAFFTTYMIPFAVICAFSLIALSVVTESTDVIRRRLTAE